MKRLSILTCIVALVLFSANPVLAGTSNGDKSGPNKKGTDYENRFKKGASEFGVQVGWGSAVDIPPGADRTDWEFAYLAPNYKYNLTGIVGKSFYRGSLSWMNEASVAVAHDPTTAVIAGFSPLMLEYKFLQPKAQWAPHVFGGAGFSYTDWNDYDRQREIATNFEFLLHLGIGAEFYKSPYGAFSANYRFFHVSNAGMKFPNIGVNANLFTIGYSFD